MKSQESIFSATEGDQYYSRNKALYLKKDWGHDDPALRAIARLHLCPRRVLEIGCSNGWRLNHIRKTYRARCVGIDPSGQAIREGRRHFPGLILKQGTADNLRL